MEDIIATTSVNTVTEEIFDETKFGGFIREEHFLLGEKNATCSLKFGRYFSNSLKSLDKHGLAGSVTNNLWRVVLNKDIRNNPAESVKKWAWQIGVFVLSSRPETLDII